MYPHGTLWGNSKRDFNKTDNTVSYKTNHDITQFLGEKKITQEQSSQTMYKIKLSIAKQLIPSAGIVLITSTPVFVGFSFHLIFLQQNSKHILACDL